MPKTIDNEEYLNTLEAIAEFGVSRKHFYENVKQYLRTYRFDAKQTPWYKKREIIGLRDGKPVRHASIRIPGILADWTSYLGSLGFHSETEDRMRGEIVTLPEDAVERFPLSSDNQYLKRVRMTRANGIPICTWDTYYPLELVSDIVGPLKQGKSISIPEYIKDKHGVVIGCGKDKLSTRITVLEEQNLFQLFTDETVFELRRVAYTKNKATLVFYQSMVLLSSWFEPEYEYAVDIWDK